MRRALAAATLAACTLALATPAGAVVLDFDNLPDGSLPAGYGTLDWSAAGWTVFSTTQEPYNAHSGSGRIADAFGGTDGDSRIGFAAPVVFDGAWVAGQQGALLAFDLFWQGQAVWRSGVLDPSATPVFLASGYAGWVDALQVHSDFHGEFVLDDLGFTAAPVPEPQTRALLGLGVLALLAAAARHGRADPNRQGGH